MDDIPFLNRRSIRGLFYVQDINRELDQEKPATLSQLAENSEWRSNYYTSLHKNLAPQLINKVRDGNNTRLELTRHGESAVHHYRLLNEVLDEANL